MESVAAGMEMATTDGTGAEGREEDACHDLLLGREEAARMQVAEVY